MKIILRSTFNKIIKVFLSISISTLFVSLFFILTQDIQIFPGVINGAISNTSTPPEDFHEEIIETSDGERIILWHTQPKDIKSKQVVLMFHGNGDSIENLVEIQKVFALIGMASYSVEYRGYGSSTGFPSERGIYIDSEAAIEFILKKERISAKDIIVYGNSIGTAPASYVANKFNVGTLVLTAPFTSLPSVVKETPLFGYLHSFVWYSFPNQEYISQLKNTCVVSAHGKQDTIIPYHHSVKLKESYKGNKSYTLITSDSSGHNDILSATFKEILVAINKCDI